MSMDHIEENYVKSLESRVKELETTLARAELQIKDWVNFLQRAKEENARLRKVIDETCPRSSECSKMSKVVEAARFAEQAIDSQAKLRGIVASLVVAGTRLKESLRELDGEICPTCKMLESDPNSIFCSNWFHSAKLKRCIKCGTQAELNSFESCKTCWNAHHSG